MRASVTGNHALDEEYFKLHTSFINAGELYHCESAVAASQRLHVERRRVEAKLARLANARTTNSGTPSWSKRLPCLLDSSKLVCYVDCAAYDETPLPTGSKRAPLTADATQDLDTSVHDVGYELALVALKRLIGKVKDDSVSAKVLQTRSSFGMCLVIDNKFAKLTGTHVCPLQVLGHGTADVLREALLRGSYVSKWSIRFSLRTRMACIDRAGYNLKAENLLPKSRDDSLSSLPIFCKTHICSNTIGHTLNDLMPMQVTGIIAVSLSLRHGNCLNLLCQCLQEEISSQTQDHAWHHRRSCS